MLRGPVIVERPDTTILVGINQSLEVEPYGNFILRLSESGIQSHV